MSKRHLIAMSLAGEIRFSDGDWRFGIGQGTKTPIWNLSLLKSQSVCVPN